MALARAQTWHWYWHETLLFAKVVGLSPTLTRRARFVCASDWTHFFQLRNQEMKKQLDAVAPHLLGQTRSKSSSRFLLVVAGAPSGSYRAVPAPDETPWRRYSTSRCQPDDSHGRRPLGTTGVRVTLARDSATGTRVNVCRLSGRY